MVFNLDAVSGNIRPASEILANIRYILDDKSPAPDYPLGVMTSQDRDTWTRGERAAPGGRYVERHTHQSRGYSMPSDGAT